MNWDTYFISLCFLIAQKSKDSNTKCGCIAVTSDNVVLSLGFNGPPRNFPDEKAPQTRPEKYIIYEHSERNAIYSAARNGVVLKDATFYITGPACADCLRAMIQVGAKKIVYGPNTHSGWNEEAKKNNEFLLLGQNIEVVEYKDYDSVLDFIEKTKENFLNAIIKRTKNETIH